MSMQDLLSDYIARINNSLLAGKSSVKVIKSKLVVDISKWLTKREFFYDFKEVDNFYLEITLNPKHLGKLVRVSTPGKRVYTSYKKFPVIKNGLGFLVISTPKGILSHVECKREKNQVGGEILFQITKPNCFYNV